MRRHFPSVVGLGALRGGKVAAATGSADPDPGIFGEGGEASLARLGACMGYVCAVGAGGWNVAREVILTPNLRGESLVVGEREEREVPESGGGGREGKEAKAGGTTDSGGEDGWTRRGNGLVGRGWDGRNEVGSR